MTCPHCYTKVPYGASVCRGCWAEIEYGMPNYAYGFCFFIPLFIGVNIGESTPVLGWVVGIALFLIISYICEKIFKDRVIFKRDYDHD